MTVDYSLEGLEAILSKEAPGADTDISIYCQNINSSCDQLAKIGSKYALAAAHGSTTSELCNSSFSEFFACLKTLCHCVSEIPNSVGSSLRQFIVKCVQNIIHSTKELMKAEAPQAKVSVGMFLQNIQVLKQCPRNNPTYIATKLTVIIAQITDAMDECDQLLQGHAFDGDCAPDDNETLWLYQAKKLLKTNILSLSKIQLLFINTAQVSPTWIKHSEEIYTLALQISSSADDFVSSLDLPLDMDDEFMINGAKDLIRDAKIVLKLAQDCSQCDWFTTCDNQLSTLLGSLKLN